MSPSWIITIVFAVVCTALFFVRQNIDKKQLIAQNSGEREKADKLSQSYIVADWIFKILLVSTVISALFSLAISLS